MPDKIELVDKEAADDNSAAESMNDCSPATCDGASATSTDDLTQILQTITCSDAMPEKMGDVSLNKTQVEKADADDEVEPGNVPRADVQSDHSQHINEDKTTDQANSANKDGDIGAERIAVAVEVQAVEEMQINPEHMTQAASPGDVPAPQKGDYGSVGQGPQTTHQDDKLPSRCIFPYPEPQSLCQPGDHEESTRVNSEATLLCSTVKHSAATTPANDNNCNSDMDSGSSNQSSNVSNAGTDSDRAIATSSSDKTSNSASCDTGAASSTCSIGLDETVSEQPFRDTILQSSNRAVKSVDMLAIPPRGPFSYPIQTSSVETTTTTDDEDICDANSHSVEACSRRDAAATLITKPAAQATANTVCLEISHSARLPENVAKPPCRCFTCFRHEARSQPEPVLQSVKADDGTDKWPAKPTESADDATDNWPAKPSESADDATDKWPAKPSESADDATDKWPAKPSESADDATDKWPAKPSESVDDESDTNASLDSADHNGSKSASDESTAFTDDPATEIHDDNVRRETQTSITMQIPDIRIHPPSPSDAPENYTSVVTAQKELEVGEPTFTSECSYFCSKTVPLKETPPVTTKVTILVSTAGYAALESEKARLSCEAITEADCNDNIEACKYKSVSPVPKIGCSESDRSFCEKSKTERIKQTMQDEASSDVQLLGSIAPPDMTAMHDTTAMADQLHPNPQRSTVQSNSAHDVEKCTQNVTENSAKPPAVVDKARITKKNKKDGSLLRAKHKVDEREAVTVTRSGRVSKPVQRLSYPADYIQKPPRPSPPPQKSNKPSARKAQAAGQAKNVVTTETDYDPVNNVVYSSIDAIYPFSPNLASAMATGGEDAYKDNEAKLKADPPVLKEAMAVTTLTSGQVLSNNKPPSAPKMTASYTSDHEKQSRLYPKETKSVTQDDNTR